MVSQQIINIIIKAENQAESQTKKVEDQFKKIGDNGKSSFDKINNSSERTSQKFQDLGSKIDKTVQNVNKVGNEGSQSFQKLDKSQQDAVTKFNMLDKNIQTTLQAIHEVGSTEMFPDSDKALNAFSQMNNLTKSWSGSMDYAKTKMELLGKDTNTLKGKIQTTGMAIQTYLGTKWDGIKTKVSSVAQSVKGKVGGAIDFVKGKTSGLSNAFNKLSSGTKTTGGNLGFLGNAASMAAGIIGTDLLNGLIESGRESMNSASQLDYFGGRLEKMTGKSKLSSDQFKKFKGEIGDLQKEFRKVDMTAVGATAEEIAVKMNLPANKLSDLTRMTAVLSSTFVKEGRTQEDAVLAVGDALDGQFRRLQEIGITQDTLKANGWNGNLEDQASLIDALNKSMKKMGYEQTAKDVTNLDEAWNALTVAGGLLLQKVLIPMTPTLISIIESAIGVADGIGSLIDGCLNFVNALPDWAKEAGGIGIFLGALILLSAFILTTLIPTISTSLMSALVSFGSMVGVTIIPEMATLSGALFTVAGAAWAAIAPFLPFIIAIGAIAVAVYEVGKAFGWWNDVGSMLEHIQAGVMRLWNAFINHPDVQAAIAGISSALSWLGNGISWALGQVLKFFNVSTGNNWDIVLSIIHGIGDAWNALKNAANTVIGVFQSIYNFAVPIGQGIYNALKPIICVLLGCSPGIVPALEKVQEMFGTVWNWISSFIVGIVGNVVSGIQPVLDVLFAIGNFLVTTFQYSWQTLIMVFNIVTTAVNNIMTTFSMFLSGQITLSSMLSMVWNTINMMFATVLSTILSRAVSFASALITRAIAAGRGFVNGIITFVSTLPAKFRAYMVHILSNIISIGGQWVNNARNKAYSLVIGVIIYVATLPGRVASILWNVVASIVSAGTSWVSNATSIASRMVSAVINNVTQLPGRVYSEFMNIGSRIMSAGSDLVNKAKQIGSNIVNGLLDAMGIHSPGTIQTKVVQEFKDMVGGVEEQMDPAADVAKKFGENIVDNFGDINLDVGTPDLGYVDLDATKMPSMDIGLDTDAVESTNSMVASSYDTLASNTGASLQAMVNNDINSYNKIKQNDAKTLQNMVNTDKSAYNKIRTNDSKQLAHITNNLKSKMNTMATKVNSSMNTMINKNKSGLNSARNTTKTQLSQITTATTKANQQMIKSWKHMKEGIVSAAEKIKSDSTTHFNTLESTIRSFYHKLQNPGGFGAPMSGTSRVSRAKHSGSSGFRKMANIIRQNQLPKYMTLGEIQRSPFLITPKSDYITRDPKTQKYNVADLIRYGNIDIPVDVNAGSWTDHVPKHVNKIKNLSKNWSIKGPKIINKYQTNHGFKVSDFINGTPKIDYNTFRGMAEDVFSQTHYDFYNDSEKYGSWQRAFQTGYFNCSDGSDAIIAMARACGLPAYKVHGHWTSGGKTYGHYWANVAGHKMDTTGWQNRRSWTPSASHAGPAPKSWSLEDLWNELKSSLENDTSQDEVYVNDLPSELTINGTITHDFLNLPEGITADEIARLIQDAPNDEGWIKKLVKNVIFQKWDLKEKARLEGKANRARGV